MAIRYVDTKPPKASKPSAKPTIPAGTTRPTGKESETMKTKKDAATDQPKRPAPIAPPMVPSAALAAVVGSAQITRPEITKKLWQYIRDHKLQDLEHRRVIKPDATFAAIFGDAPFDMMKLAKGIERHLSPAPAAQDAGRLYQGDGTTNKGTVPAGAGPLAGPRYGD